MESDIFFKLIYWVEMLISGFIFYKILSFFARPLPIKWLIPLLIFSLSIVGNTIIYNEDPINVTYAMIGFLLIMLIGFRASLWSRLSAVLVIYPIMTAINFMETLILFSFAPNYLFSNYEFFCYVAIEAVKIIVWYLIYLLAKKYLKGVICYLDGLPWFFVDIICLAPFVSIIIAVMITPDEKSWGAMAICLVTIITCLAMFMLLNTLVDKMRSLGEIENLKLRNSYYKELETKQKLIRRMRHDIRNHLETALSLLQSAKVKEAETYLQNLTGKIGEVCYEFCDNSIINAVLNGKYKESIDRGITCDFKVDISSSMSIDSIDMCTIIGNTLDNAIDAASISPSPTIKLRIRTNKNYLFYQISNTKINPIKERGSVFFTGKADKDNHGLGLEIVKSIVAGYDGTLSIDYDDAMFELLIIIKL